MDKVTVTLKPCPFCGGDRARTIHIRDGRKVACICGACSKPCFHGPLEQPSAEERAVEAWNTRQAEEQIKLLREALETAHGMLASFAGQPTHIGDVFKVLDAAAEATNG